MDRFGFTHEAPVPATYEWYTPPRIFDALGLRFDMDVCSPGADVVPWIPADRHLTIADHDSTPWTGRVWMNPPYGKETPLWLRKFLRHGNGIALVMARTDTKWFQKLAFQADAMLFVEGRVRFIRPSGEQSRDPTSGSVLLACGAECTAALKQSELGRCIETKGNER